MNHRHILRRIPAVAAIGLALSISPLFSPRTISAKNLPPGFTDAQLERGYKKHAEDNYIQVRSVHWSPDHRRMFYILYENNAAASTDEYATLYCIHRDGTHQHKIPVSITSIPDGKFVDENSLCWSADGSRILMEDVVMGGSVNLDGFDLIDMDPDVGVRRLLTGPINSDVFTGQVVDDPNFSSFSPNGKYLLVTLGSGRWMYTNKRLVRIDYATGVRHILTHSDLPRAFEAASMPAWSPDSHRIAFVAFIEPYDHEPTRVDTPFGEQHLYIMDADGTNQHSFSHDQRYFEGEARWTSDGKLLEVVRFENKDGSWARSLWTVCPDGSHWHLIKPLSPVGIQYSQRKSFWPANKIFPQSWRSLPSTPRQSEIEPSARIEPRK